MKIQGPGGPKGLPPTAPVGNADRADASSPVDKTRETQPAAPVTTPAPPDAVASVAAELRAGTITPEKAVERLVDMTLGSVGAKLPEAARAELRGRLEALLAEDPYLQAKARRIGITPASEE